MYTLLWILILSVVKEKDALPAKKVVECGYKQCPQTRDGALNVHLIAHSHMDAGWVKTFDEYYYGSKTVISSANVQLIYHSVLSELLHDRRRKFTFSESSYFWRWWKEQRPATRATFRSMVQEGRIEFAGGGWVQSDEATTDYAMLLDQYTWGLRKINDTLGPCGKPKAAWQIDAYGHTREHASLLAQMGYDGLFIGRVDHKERESMLEDDRMEFMWRGSDILGKMSDIMTHTLYNLYNAPEGFCFDFLCNEEPIVDDADNRVYNAEKRVTDFISQIERQAKYYEHDNIMVTMGGDFTYQSAAHWFMNMDKLINHVNTHPANMSDINIFYSTPSCYLKALYLYGRRDKAIYTEKGELLPYGSDGGTYWTGFYTSRPSTKYLARQAHAFLQVAKQLTVITHMSDSYELHLLRHAVALMMHHDAITGTSQQHVANDFIRTVTEAIDATAKKVSNLLSHLTPTWGGTRRSKTGQQFVTCHQMNISQCRFAETQESLLLIVYNPLSVKTYYFVRLPAIALHFSIRNPNDEEVEYQLVPLPMPVVNLPKRNSVALQELVFEAENVPPLGYLAYHISPIRDQLEENEYAKKQTMNPETEKLTQISNEYLKVAVDKTTGLLESIQHVDGMKILVSQNFYFYGQGRQTLQSGAYSFRPETERPTQVVQNVTYTSVRGMLVKEIRQRFTDWIHQTLRLYRGEEFLELEWVVGPVPIGNDLGKEIVSLFTTNISNRGDFYTDSNMRQVIKRSCKNETAGQTTKKPVAACYYPVTSRICIQSFNSTSGLCVLPDRTQGGTSYREGEIELMVHRRLLTDDGFGLEETLNEEENGVGLIVRGKHRILFGNYRQEVDELTFNERMSQAAHRWKMEPWQFLASGDKINRRKWQSVRNKRYAALRPHGLPRHVRILTLEPWKTGSVLLRLENTLQKTDRGRSMLSEMTEDYPKSTTHVSVELRKLFQHLQIKSVRETTLGANQWLEEARQMDWSTRYVYNGGDDGILNEDLDYADDTKNKQRDRKESAHYSEEDIEFGRKVHRHKQNDKIKSKLRPGSYEDKFRRKRSLNGTEDFRENIINVDYNHTERMRLYTTERTKVIEKVSEKVSDTTFDIMDMTQSTVKETVTLTPKSIVLKKPIQRKQDNNFGSSEEEESLTLMRRKRKKMERKKRPVAMFSEISPDETDDGVTKSIYEMYYKTKAKVNFRPMVRGSEETSENAKQRKRKRKFRSKDFEQQDKLDRSRRKKAKRKINNVKLDMPFFITAKRSGADSGEKRGEEGEEDDEKNVDMPFFKRKNGGSGERRGEEGGEEDEEKDTSDEPVRPPKREEEEEEEEEEKEERRRKRAITKEDDVRSDPSGSIPDLEPEYIITLRPTQIRSFVIRFLAIKNQQYVI